MDPKLLRKYTKQNIDKNGNTLLHKAVKESNFILLFKAALMETSVNKQNTDGYSALHYAVKHGDHSMVEAVLQCGVSPLLKTKTGEAAKDIATRHKKADIVDLLEEYEHGLEHCILHRDTSRAIDLLHKWVNLNNVSRSASGSDQGSLFKENIASMSLDFYRHQNNFIHIVASDDYEEVSLILAKQGHEKTFNVNAIHSSNGATPLSVAIQNSNVKMVNLLLDRGANPGIRLFDGTPLTHYAWDIRVPFQIILCLLRDSQTWHMRSPTEGLTILFALAKDASITPVHVHKLLEVTDCSVLMDRDSEGRDIYEFCLHHQREDLIESIQESVAELLSRRNGKLTLIRLAVASLGQTVLKVPEHIFTKVFGEEVLQSRIDVYQQFLDNMSSLETESTALFAAVSDGNLAEVKKHNIADFINKNGRTALHEAILSDKYDIATWLMAERPSLRLIGDLGNRYPLHYAYAVAHHYGKRYVHLLLESSDRDDLEKLTDMNNKVPSTLGISLKDLATRLQ